MHLLRNHENWAFVQVMSDADGTEVAPHPNYHFRRKPAILRKSRRPTRRYRRMGW